MDVPLDDGVRRRLDQAKADLAIAQELRGRYPHQACFHAQQAAEKSLKALLTRLAGDATPTNEIDRLLTTVERLAVVVPNDVPHPASTEVGKR